MRNDTEMQRVPKCKDARYEWKAQPMVLRTPRSKGLRQLSCRYNDLQRRKALKRYDSERKLTAANLLTGQYLEKELGAKVERLIANAKKEVEESLISSLEQKLKENLAKDTIEKMNIPEVLKRFTEMSLEQKQ